MKVEELNMGVVRFDGGTQMRAELDRDVYLDYGEKMKAGDEFPPVDVFYDGTEYFLADGFHRFHGSREAKLKTIKATIHKGTLRDAILFAIGANAKHGLKRTREDKRNSVEKLLNDEEWAQWSDERIADAAGVARSFVGEVRSQLVLKTGSAAAAAADKPRIGKDGRKRKAPKNRKPAKKKNTAPAPVAPPDAPPPAESEGTTAKPPTFEESVKARNLEIDRYCQRIVAAFKDSQPKDAWLDDSRLNIAKQQIDSACATLRISKGHDKPCPKCAGEGCKLCRQCGYMPKNEYQMAGGK